MSRQIRAIFARYTALIEPLSLDEAYLDVTEDVAGLGSATATALAIRAAIKAETGLTASAGISYNKFIAKIASDQNKPDGQCVITPARGPAFVAALPVKRFHGVGPKTAEKMARLGIATGADLRAKSLTGCSLRSAAGAAICTTPPAGWTTGRCAPIASANRWAPRTPSSPICAARPN